MTTITTIKIIMTAMWLIGCVLTGLAGKVKLINDVPLSPLLGAFLAPFIVTALGAVFLLCGVIGTLPILLWINW